MNALIGKGKSVHATIAGEGIDPICGSHLSRSGAFSTVTRTSSDVTCQRCLKLAPPAPIENTYRITYRKNTLARGWVTKSADYTGTEERVTKLIAKMMTTSGFQILSSVKI